MKEKRSDCLKGRNEHGTPVVVYGEVKKLRVSAAVAAGRDRAVGPRGVVFAEGRAMPAAAVEGDILAAAAGVGILAAAVQDILAVAAAQDTLVEARSYSALQNRKP